MIWAIIKTQVEGIHYWKDAPEEVWFLKFEHRHLFNIEVWIEQEHTERDVEYIQEKRRLTKNVKSMFMGASHEWSCETIAEGILKLYQGFYPNRKIKVFVFEDNENGALVE